MITPKSSKAKYKAKSVRIDGIYFPSKAEATRYTQLKTLAQAGEIGDLKVHPRFIIWQHGKEKIVYEADFQYNQGKSVIVEDVKGVETPVYRIKKKMFTAMYPDLLFVEIKRGKAVPKNT